MTKAQPKAWKRLIDGEIKILDPLLGMFSPTTTIRVHPDYFYFSTNTEKLQLQTYIMVFGSGKSKGKVAGVGEIPNSKPDLHRIDLFKNTPLPPGISRAEALEAFMRFAVSKLYNRTRVIRPLVIVKGIRSLDPLLLGYQNAFIKKVLDEAGAREVRFED